MLSFLLCASLQSAQSIPHAAIHPPEAVVLSGFHDLAKAGAAYGDAPLFRFARDERILGLIESATGEALDPALIAPESLFDLLIDELPPEALAMGMDELLNEVRKASYSVTPTPDFESAAMDALRTAWTLVEMEQLSADIRTRGGVIGDSTALEAVYSDDPEFRSDAWGRPYVFEATPDIGFTLRSLGADGEPGGEGAGSDLVATPGGTEQPPPAILQPLLDAAGLQMAFEFASGAGADRLMSLAELASLELAGEIESEPFSLAAGSGSLDGLRFTIAGDGVQFGFWLGVRDSVAVLGAGAIQPEAVANRLASTPSVPDRIRSGLAGLPSRGGTPLVTSYERYSQWAMFVMALDAAMSTGGAEVLARLSEGAVSAAQIQELSDRVGADPRSRLTRGSLVGSTFYTDTLRPGPGRPATSLSPADLATVNPEAALVVAGGFSPEAAYDLLLEIGAGVQGVSPEDYHAQGVDLLGMDLRKDLIAQFGSTYAVSLEPVQALGPPKLMFHAQIEDPERVSATLNSIVESIAAALPEDFEAQTRPYRGMPLARLALKGLDIPISIEPSFGLFNDRLIFGLTGTQVKKELRRLGKGEAQPHRLLGDPQVGFERQLSSLTYFDWPTFVSSAYDMGRALAGLAGGMPPDVPIALDDLPDGEIFEEYFQPSVITVRETPGGRRVQGVASFGPELGLMIQAASAGAQAFVEDSMPDFGNSIVLEADPIPLQRTDPMGLTNEAMNRVRVALQVYFYEHESAYPATLDALSQPTADFPQGALDGEPLPNDGWSRALRYTVDPGGQGYRLWSVGPDGVDQSGAGDDIVVTVR
ncbi:MAG: type II secretion system protein GspG [Planctomycetota bacterium]